MSDLATTHNANKINSSHLFASAIAIATSNKVEDLWPASSLAALRLSNKCLKVAVDSNLVIARVPSEDMVQFFRCNWVRNVKSLSFPGSVSASALEAVLTTPLLPNLHTLKLGHCEAGVEEELSSKKPIKIHLKYLSIGDLEWSMFPSWILDLPSLEFLEIKSGLKLGIIPNEISSLTALEYFKICLSDKINVLPESIGQLKKLRLLCLEGCSELGKLPTSL